MSFISPPSLRNRVPPSFHDGAEKLPPGAMDPIDDSAHRDAAFEKTSLTLDTPVKSDVLELETIPHDEFSHKGVTPCSLLNGLVG